MPTISCTSAVELHGAPDRRRVSSEAALPQGVAQHDDAAGAAHRILVSEERPAAGATPSSGKSDGETAAASMRAGSSRPPTVYGLARCRRPAPRSSGRCPPRVEREVAQPRVADDRGSRPDGAPTAARSGRRPRTAAGRSRTPYTAENTAVFTPIASASVPTAASVNPRARPISRMPDVDPEAQCS